MPRHALALPLALALLAPALLPLPALAQTQGAPGTSSTTPRALPGTGGANAVPDSGQAGNSGKGRGTTNDPNSGRSGPHGETTTGTGALQGGGGPLGQHSPQQR